MKTACGFMISKDRFECYEYLNIMISPGSSIALVGRGGGGGGGCPLLAAIGAPPPPSNAHATESFYEWSGPFGPNVACVLVENACMWVMSWFILLADCFRI